MFDRLQRPDNDLESVALEGELAQPPRPKRVPGRNQRAGTANRYTNRPITARAVSPAVRPSADVSAPTASSGAYAAEANRVAGARNRAQQQLAQSGQARRATYDARRDADQARIRAAFSQARSDVRRQAQAESAELASHVHAQTTAMCDAYEAIDLELRDAAVGHAICLQDYAYELANQSVAEAACQANESAEYARQYLDRCDALGDTKRNEYADAKRSRRVAAAIDTLVATAKANADVLCMPTLVSIEADGVALGERLVELGQSMQDRFRRPPELDALAELVTTTRHQMTTELLPTVEQELSETCDAVCAEIDTAEGQAVAKYDAASSLFIEKDDAAQLQAGAEFDGRGYGAAQAALAQAADVFEQAGLTETDRAQAYGRLGIAQSFDAAASRGFSAAYSTQTPLEQLVLSFERAAIGDVGGAGCDQVRDIADMGRRQVDDAISGTLDTCRNRRDALRERWGCDEDEARAELQGVYDQGVLDIAGKVASLRTELDGQHDALVQAIDERVEHITSESLLKRIGQGIVGVVVGIGQNLATVLKFLGKAALYVTAAIAVAALIAVVIGAGIAAGGFFAAMGIIAAAVGGFVLGLLSLPAVMVGLVILGIVVAGFAVWGAIKATQNYNMSVYDQGKTWGKAIVDTISMFAPQVILAKLRTLPQLQRFFSATGKMVAESRAGQRAGEALQALANNKHFIAGYKAGQDTPEHLAHAANWVGGKIMAPERVERIGEAIGWVSKAPKSGIGWAHDNVVPVFEGQHAVQGAATSARTPEAVPSGPQAVQRVYNFDEERFLTFVSDNLRVKDAHAIRQLLGVVKSNPERRFEIMTQIDEALGRIWAHYDNPVPGRAGFEAAQQRIAEWINLSFLRNAEGRSVAFIESAPLDDLRPMRGSDDTDAWFSDTEWRGSTTFDVVYRYGDMEDLSRLPDVVSAVAPLARKLEAAGDDLEALRKLVFNQLDIYGSNGVRNQELFRDIAWGNGKYGDAPDVVDRDILRMLEVGGGVCRHQAFVGHLVLARRGIRSRIRGVELEGVGSHAVLEVDGQIIDFNESRRVYRSLDDYLAREGVSLAIDSTVSIYDKVQDIVRRGPQPGQRPRHINIRPDETDRPGRTFEIKERKPASDAAQPDEEIIEFRDRAGEPPGRINIRPDENDGAGRTFTIKERNPASARTKPDEEIIEFREHSDAPPSRSGAEGDAQSVRSADDGEGVIGRWSQIPERRAAAKMPHMPNRMSRFVATKMNIWLVTSDSAALGDKAANMVEAALQAQPKRSFFGGGLTDMELKIQAGYPQDAQAAAQKYQAITMSADEIAQHYPDGSVFQVFGRRGGENYSFNARLEDGQLRYYDGVTGRQGDTVASLNNGVSSDLEFVRTGAVDESGLRFTSQHGRWGRHAMPELNPSGSGISCASNSKNMDRYLNTREIPGYGSREFTLRLTEMRARPTSSLNDLERQVLEDNWLEANGAARAYQTQIIDRSGGKLQNWDEFDQLLSGYPEGATFVLFLNMKSGDGAATVMTGQGFALHAFNARVENGRAVYYDASYSREYTRLADYADNSFSLEGFVQAVRTDEYWRRQAARQRR